MFGFSKYSTATYRVQNVFESIHDPFDLYHISDSIGEVSRSNQITPPDRVELMLNSQQSIITAVDHDTLMVSVSPPINLEADKPCFAGGKERVIVHSESSEVFLMDVEGLKVGDQVVQTAFTGKVDDLFELFRAEWSQRWDRHRHVPPSQWQQIMEFNARHLPRQSCPYLEITDRQLQAEIARKNPKRASGPDGVSLSDLCQLPLEAITAHTKLLKRAEMDGSWPSQTLVGRVASLGKVEHPTKITDFRPITVISHIYRLWSGLRAKEILQWLDGVCPPFLLGNRPSCMASHSWSHVQWMIEVTFWQQSSLAGLTADIQKAFNHLPREVLMQACLILGVPQPILLAWSGALSGLVRRFQVRDSLGPAIYSTTGCPEGCAMSCIGMLVIDIMLHKWLVQQCPICQPMSYVDDWQVLVKQPHFLQGIYESLVSFTRAVDLLLDGRKTFAWTLDSGVRKTLRQQGLIVKRSAKALGAQMQFSKQHAAFVIHDRLKDLQPLWLPLRDSQSPYTVKVHAVKMAAWPRGLHGISAVCLGTTRFGPLRSAAMKGLNADGSGCNPVVHLGLIEKPMVDPQFWSIMTTFRSLRDCATAESLYPLLMSVVENQGLLPRGGPTNALLQRIHTLGWTVCSDGRVSDQWGSFSLFTVSLQELLFRAEAAWTQVVSAAVQHRQCFQGLCDADAKGTRAFVTKLTVQDQGLMRKALNGASFTNDSQCYYTSSGSSQCEFCGQTDSRFHRFWQCPVFESARRDVPRALLARIDTLPPCLTHAGWRIKPPTMDQWWATLVSLPTPEIEVTLQLPDRSWYDLFTDGSCLWPNAPSYRVASWSVCLAGFSADWTDSQVLEAGPLPGLLQSAYRAELYAIYIAVKWGRVNKKSIRIWSDCLGVIRRFRKLTRTRQLLKHGVAHYDLWLLIYEELQQLTQTEVLITKVSAHQSLESATSDFDLWMVINNMLADRAAKLANLCRPPAFWTAHRSHAAMVERYEAEGDAIQNVILEISRQVVVREACHQADGSLTREQSDMPPADELEEPGTWTMFEVMQPVSWKLTQRYGFLITARITAWLKEGLQSAVSASEPVRWVSAHQLYLDFQLATADMGPVYDKGWVDTTKRPDIRLRHFPYRRRSAWFLRVLKQIVHYSNGQLDFRVVRPHSTVFALHTACAWIPWSTTRLDWVEEWTSTKVSRSITGDGQLMDALPIPKRDERWPFLHLEERPLSL